MGRRPLAEVGRQSRRMRVELRSIAWEAIEALAQGTGRPVSWVVAELLYSALEYPASEAIVYRLELRRRHWE